MEAPAAVWCLREQHPRAAGQRRVTGSLGGDARQPFHYGELLAAIECARVREDLYPDVAAVAVYVGQAAGGQVVDEGSGVLPEHGNVRHLLDGHDRGCQVDRELVLVREGPGRRVDIDHGHGGCSFLTDRGLSDRAGSGPDDVDDDTGMGQHDDVAAVHVVGVSAHALRRETLQLGVDGAVVAGHDVPARLRAPGGTFGLGVEQARVRWDVGRPDQPLLRLGQGARERLDALRAHPDAPVRDLDVVENVRDGELVLLALGGLRFVRGKRGQVDQAGDAVIGARSGDQGAAVGVADEQDGAADPAYRAGYRRDITFERVETVL